MHGHSNALFSTLGVSTYGCCCGTGLFSHFCLGKENLSSLLRSCVRAVLTDKGKLSTGEGGKKDLGLRWLHAERKRDRCLAKDLPFL